ncbi:hypothetical protein F1880_003588 [Penicillium rolfsii]|nr:hypothetical protein F1880_003588 [Penicillium rolfsii]
MMSAKMRPTRMMDPTKTTDPTKTKDLIKTVDPTKMISDISYLDDGRDHENSSVLDDESVYAGEPHSGSLSEDVADDGACIRGDLKTRFTKKSDDGDCSVREGTNYSKWKRYTPLTTIRQNSQEKYGIMLSSGSVLGWNESEENGRLLILGYECRGKRIARVKLAEKSELERYDYLKKNATEQGLPARGGSSDWTAKQISGVGLVVWEVKDTTASYITAGLYPTKNGVYLKTFIWVQWEDGNWT